MAETKPQPPDHYKGWLFKWTNYIKGYQKRWFVLENGYLSYYRNQAEMSNACRGTINLANSFIHTQDACSFVISNSGAMTFHLKAASEVERQHWVTALELAKSKAITLIESDDDEELAPLDKSEIDIALKTLNAKLEDLKTSHDLILKHSAGLQRAVVDLESAVDANPSNPADAAAKVRNVNEKATVFRIASNAMISACTEYVGMANSQGTRWQKLLQNEHEHRLYLEDMVEQLGKQHSNLEKLIRRSMHSGTAQRPGGAGGAEAAADGNDGNQVTVGMVMMNNGAPLRVPGKDPQDGDEDDDDFFDAVDDDACGGSKNDQRFDFKMSVSTDVMKSPDTEEEDDKEEDATDSVDGIEKKKKNKTKKTSLVSTVLAQGNDPAVPGCSRSGRGAVVPTRNRRKTIPEKPNISISLWGIMKNCIGRDLTKIPMPVNFSEPLSMLQRLTEEFEYSDCLDCASDCADEFEEMAYVAAFTVSAYANTTLRTGKPFNPLLGETFECDRWDDLGWKCIAEQVSHHPPTLATHAIGREGWTHWQDFTMSSKFRGKYLQIIPLGIAHLKFDKTGNHYTWRKVTTTVHNIIVGRLWVDSHGEMDITNHRTGTICRLKYYEYSYFSREVPRKVSGVITDKEGSTKYVLSGTWDDKLEGARVLGACGSSGGTVEYETGVRKILWQRRMRPAELEKCYNFTQLAVELNEMEEGVAPTDSRLRPDQRLMEQAKWDEANQTKILLEEKQRAARRAREAAMEEVAGQGGELHGYEPKWFKKQNDVETGNLIHVYTDEYWQCKEAQEWSRCPDIYLSPAELSSVLSNQ